MKIARVEFIKAVNVSPRGMVTTLTVKDALNPKGPLADIEYLDDGGFVRVTIDKNAVVYIPRENVSFFIPVAEEKKVEPPKKP